MFSSISHFIAGEDCSSGPLLLLPSLRGVENNISKGQNYKYILYLANVWGYYQVSKCETAQYFPRIYEKYFSNFTKWKCLSLMTLSKVGGGVYFLYCYNLKLTNICLIELILIILHINNTLILVICDTAIIIVCLNLDLVNVEVKEMPTCSSCYINNLPNLNFFRGINSNMTLTLLKFENSIILFVHFIYTLKTIFMLISYLSTNNFVKLNIMTKSYNFLFIKTWKLEESFSRLS